jgi:hypothetical protein
MVFVLVVCELEMFKGARTVTVIVHVPRDGNGAARAGMVPLVKVTVFRFVDGAVVLVETVPPPHVVASVPGTTSKPGSVLSTTSEIVTPV